LLLSKLIIPKKKGFFVKEQEDLLKIALKLQKDNRVDIERYLTNYAWLSSRAYLGNFQTKNETIERVKELIKENPEKKMLQVKKKREKIRRGDIIVSPMTSPRFAPVLAKASGIITDFGGILCHAAIVSREFGS